MTQEALNEILHKHRLWLQTKDGGERANLQDEDLRYANLKCADLRLAKMQCANLEEADLRCAELRGANLQGEDLQSANLENADLGSANLWHANLEGANLQDANINYSAWPLWCGSLKAHVDNRIAIQLLYHALSVVQHSPYVSEDIKRTLLTPEVVGVANRFHRVDECGKLEIFNGGTNE